MRHASSRTRAMYLHRSVCFGFCGLVALFGWVYIVCFSPLFTIRAIEMLEGEGIDADQIRSSIFAYMDQSTSTRMIELPRRHRLRLDRERLSSMLRETFFFDRVVVRISLPSILRLSIETNNETWFLYVSEKIFLINAQGIVLYEASSKQYADVKRFLGMPLSSKPSFPSFMVIRRDDTQTPTRGMRVFTMSESRALRDVSNAVQQQRIALREVFLKPSSTQMILQTLQGFQAIVSVTDDVSDQLTRLYVFMQNKDAQSVSGIIDVRIPGRIYIRSADTWDLSSVKR